MFHRAFGGGGNHTEMSEMLHAIYVESHTEVLALGVQANKLFKLLQHP